MYTFSTACLWPCISTNTGWLAEVKGVQQMGQTGFWVQSQGFSSRIILLCCVKHLCRATLEVSQSNGAYILLMSIAALGSRSHSSSPAKLYNKTASFQQMQGMKHVYTGASSPHPDTKTHFVPVLMPSCDIPGPRADGMPA
jgi:hypothetical protein